ncbi:hypothetical protein PHLGIDRAFT_20269 [Phlebiopsis gigantea 11061_1 CR5-6]|uniref:CFEM domain-containing protein n=1 Tax=Phlebiopsis gigantea (strain 11061_1 CR5-6) TaxID=745531 RepID=A0A0C3RSE7_PHLG1|nr:hypothetical protein PHLGIDRAFT_20269 [Phlebiopsis gigantea 11061_1 CR5-6]
MHFTAVIVATFFGAVTASAALLQQRQTASFPTCATDCVLNPPSLFGCSATDNQCLCTNQQYVAATTQCIETACSATDAASAEAASRQLCEAVGVTITASSSTPTATSASDSSAASGTGSASVPAASSTNPASSGASSSASSSSAAPSATQSQSSAVSNRANALIGVAALFLAAVNL